MITRLNIQGYRSLKATGDINLGPLTVLIGPNGGGKTNVLDFFAFLAEAADGKMLKGVLNRGGFQSLVFAKGTETISWDIELSLSPHDDQERVRYRTTLRARQHAPFVESEDMSTLMSGEGRPLMTSKAGETKFRRESQGDRDLTLVSTARDQSELAFTQIRDPLVYPTLDTLCRYVSEWRIYKNLNTGFNAPIRQPQFASPDSRLLASGDNVTTVLHFLSSRPQHKDAYDEIIETLKVAYPHFDALNFPPEYEGKISLRWKVKQFEKDFPAMLLSDGMLRFLCLATILMSPDPPPLICIDEPELGLHPSLLRITADLLKDAASRTQLIVATHSPELVSLCDVEHVAIVELNDEGATTIKRLADRPGLEKWLQDFSLGELWTMGELGGRP